MASLIFATDDGWWSAAVDALPTAVGPGHLVWVSHRPVRVDPLSAYQLAAQLTAAAAAAEHKVVVPAAATAAVPATEASTPIGTDPASTSIGTGVTSTDMSIDHQPTAVDGAAAIDASVVDKGKLIAAVAAAKAKPLEHTDLASMAPGFEKEPSMLHQKAIAPDVVQNEPNILDQNGIEPDVAQKGPITFDPAEEIQKLSVEVGKEPNITNIAAAEGSSGEVGAQELKEPMDANDDVLVPIVPMAAFPGAPWRQAAGAAEVWTVPAHKPSVPSAIVQRPCCTHRR